jgi:hypothetical protein
MSIDVLFIAGFGPVVREPTGARRLFAHALGIRFDEEKGAYLHTESLDGVRHTRGSNSMSKM